MQSDSDEELDSQVSEVTASEIVNASYVSVSQLNSMEFADERAVDKAENASIVKFYENGCNNCHYGDDNGPCCASMSVDHYHTVRCQMQDLTHDELDLVVMGQIMAGCTDPSLSGKRLSHTTFFHCGKRICLKTFLFLHSIGYTRYKNIKASYLVRGVETRVHKNKGRHPVLGLSFDDVKGVIQFVMNYSGTIK